MNIGMDTNDNFREFILNLLDHCSQLPGRRSPLPSGRGGLVVIDPQRFFCDPDSPGFLRDWPSIESGIQSLGEAFRRKNLPARTSRFLGPEPGKRPVFDAMFSRPFAPDDPLTELLPHWQTPCWQPSVTKDSFSLFAAGDPGFPDDLTWLALTGVRLDRCVVASLFGAHAAGIIPLLVADCVAAVDRETHRSVTRLIADGHGLVVTAAELLQHLETI